MKKCIALVLVLLALVCCAAADEPTEYTCGDFEYILLDDGTAEITKYTGGAAELVVPDTLDGYRVTGIGDSAFSRCKSLMSITLPEGVTSIGDYAFEYCSALTSITLPEGVTSIGDRAFYSCKSLTSITLPECVTSIGDYAFSSCASLTSIEIPDSVTQMGANPFAACEMLTDIHVSLKHPWLATIDGVLFDKTEKRLICYPCAFTASGYAVPNGILSIGDYAFSFCYSLTSITIPEGVTSIGVCAFSSCASLTSITLPDGLASIGYGAFYSCKSLTSITLPEGVTSIAADAFFSCKSLTSITLPRSLASIGDYAFYSCKSLTSITLPEGVTSIGYYAFDSCKSLTSITLPRSLTSIGWWAIDESEQLTCIVPVNSYAEQWCKENNISFAYGNADGRPTYMSGDFVYFLLHDGTVQIDAYVGSDQRLNVPAQLDGYPATAIGKQAFRDADLVSVTLPDTVTKLEGNPFSTCGRLAEVWISPDHSALATIDGVLFDKTDKKLLCYPAGLGAQSYAVPDGIRSIGAEAFGGCRLTDVTLPASVADIAADAFAGGQGGIFFTVPRDSYAAQWCRDNNVRYTYPDANNWLLN